MIIKVKHDITQHLAKDRIKQLLEDTIQKHSGLINTHDFNWNGNSCDIRLSAMKMQFKGKVTVHKDEVLVDVNVPLIFFGYQSKIKSIVEEELSKVLK